MLATSTSGDALRRRSSKRARRVALEVDDDDVLLRPQHLREVVVAMDAYRVSSAISRAARRQAGRHTGPQHRIGERTRVFGQSIRAASSRYDALSSRACTASLSRTHGRIRRAVPA